MMNQMAKDIVGRFGGSASGKGVRLYVAYSYDREAAEIFTDEVKQHFPDTEPQAYALSLSVSCHIGPGSIAIACSKIESY